MTGVISNYSIDREASLEEFTRENFDEIVTFDYVGNIPALKKFLNGIEVYAIEYVVFHIHDSDISPEFLSHRLGLIAIDTEKVENRVISFDTDQGRKQMVKATLNYRNEGVTVEPVTSSNIKLASSDECPCVHENEEIFRMMPGKEIKCDLYMVKAKGSEHAKFQSTRLAFRYKDDSVKDHSDSVVYSVTIDLFGNYPSQRFEEEIRGRFS